MLDFEEGAYSATPPTDTPTMSPTPSRTPVPWKWTQPPNTIDGMPIVSCADIAPGAETAVVADDWICSDGKPIRGVKWWGGYPNYEPQNSSILPPPAQRPSKFILSWYSRSASEPYIPMTLLAQEEVTVFTEIAAEVPMAHYGPNSYQYEHIYEYECSLATPWNQTQNSMYFLQILAIFDSANHTYEWGWFASEYHSLEPAAKYWGESDGWVPLMWEDYHRLGYGPMGVAFDLITLEPTPTPSLTPTASLTPSPTPSSSPSPTPEMPEGSKWAQAAQQNGCHAGYLLPRE